VDAAGLVLAVLVIAVPIAIFVGALVLRASVWLANQCLWAPAKRVRAPDPEDEDGDEDEFARLKVSRTRYGTAIKPPSFGRALGLSTLCTLVQAVVALLQTFFETVARIDATQSVVLAGSCLFVSFLSTAGLCAALLPTTFGRALLVTLFDFLLTAAVVVALALPLLILFG
jgi:hypothetical protein